MRWVNAEPEHVVAISLQPAQREVVDYRQAWANEIDPDFLASFSRTLLDASGAPRLCVGAVPVRPGVGSVWLLLSTGVSAFHVARGTLRWLRYIENREGFHRVEASADIAHEEAQSFLAWLGFEVETPRARLYGPAPACATHVLYVRFPQQGVH